MASSSSSSSPTYHSIPPITHQRDVFPQQITALAFDPVSDTLWSGSNSGQLSAFYSVLGLRGVSFRVGGTLAVKKIAVDDAVVRACCVAGEGVGCWSKGGLNKWYYRTPMAVTTFSHTVQSSTLAAATPSPELVLLNALTGAPTRIATVPAVVNQLHFASSSLLLTGGSDGFLRCHDPRTGLRVASGESAVRAHASEVQGLQSNGNVVYTTGWALRSGHPVPDPLVKLYDLRTMKALPPVVFPTGPAFINVLPRSSASLVLVSNQGLVNIVDTVNPSNVEFYQLDTPAFISSAAVSPTGAFMAFGDADGVVHLLTAADETVPFNGFEGQPVEWADAPEPLPDINWTDSTPLNTIGLPHYSSLLLSSYTPALVPRPPGPPPKIPPQILAAMKTNDNVAYAPLPRELRGTRNMVRASPTEARGRFRSAKTSGGTEDTPDAGFGAGDDVPRAYRRVEIEYSRFGVEDFDFGFYNKTEYSGLETHILNSYTNALLQVMHYAMPVRALAKSHITTDCAREHCLLCELGFVVRMLEDAHGTNCQSSNFCKAAGFLAQSVNAIELIDYGRDGPELDYAHTIQSFHRFFLDRLVLESTSPPHPVLLPAAFEPDDAPSPVTQLLGLDARTVSVCGSCKARREKRSVTHVLDAVYPRKVRYPPSAGTLTFSQLLTASLARAITHKAHCGACRHYAAFESSRAIAPADLPPFLALNANAHDEDAADTWRDRRGERFLSARVDVAPVEGEEAVEYEIRSIVCKIVAKDKRSHLVALVKVPEAEDPFNSAWYLFNDFLVQNISEDEALSFPGAWKVPAILYLERVDVRGALDLSCLPEKIDMSILSRDTSISLNRDPSLIKHAPLEPYELPTPGTVVAIDAEFVMMQREEVDLRSDGTKTVLRPPRLSLARVSVLRGGGAKEGVPLIDDHIHTSEMIVDYLTEFSGINFGDLDPMVSRFTLTPLKTVYKKLRLLVDSGCIFIGHGLSKDFRIINIFVPPERVIDTVDLYFIRARQRRLSLRFLAWVVLGEVIQEHTHDSIEDARTALRLYKAFQELEANGEFDTKLEEIYREGQKAVRFLVPILPVWADTYVS
ncbi:ubiquitin carboxyl-terminal hydrolase-domain-containing protein [Vararia minispora EC-137]|uniref:Ubiquitin carboxyl-terminal hydrolase-domain-containing protein n=1 Tax=Vararia minispora EC-137 TaxID=1314806 RepID=A0ACB8QTS5_9AGAM|nr:ubiquitin carboxyl-terminal hydrolase-domain-containing protein [Vararia minispora EC-137]